MRALLRLYKKHLPLLLAVGVLYALSAICELLLPYEMGVIVSQGIKGQNEQIIYKSGAVMAVLALSALLISIFTVKINAHVAADFSRDLRIKTFNKINSLSFEEFSSIGTSSLLTRVNDDIVTLSELASSGIYTIVNVPITFIGGVILVMKKDLLMGIIMLCVSPAVIIFASLLSKRLNYLWDRGDKLTDEQNRHVRERMSGIRVLRAFDKEEEKHGKIEKATKEMVLSYIRANVLSGFINPVATVLLNFATVAIIAVSASRISYQSALSAGDIISALQYIGLILNGLLTLSWTITWLPHVAVCVKRVNQIYALKGLPESKGGELLKGEISIENLTFTYPSSSLPTLKGINFKATCGEKVAIIGGTGSGKSTIAKLIAGFYPIEKGKITFGGKVYNSDMVGSVRKSLSLALQKSMIFEGSVKDNITCFNNDYSEEQVLKVASVAQLNSFLQEKGGLNFELKQYGANISGGQKQRINIARTILKPASVYLFDDSFSALDFLTESNLRKELNAYLKDKTQIIITQRIATAMKCDRIYVLDNGEVIGCGNHKELLQTCKVYRELHHSQMGGEAV